MKNEIQIYTDGACLNNGTEFSVGGWAAILDNGKKRLKISGQVQNTTSNRMELMAIYKALKALKNENLNVKVYTDSAYARNGCVSWLEKWKNNNWKNSNRKKVENQDLWQEIDQLIQKHQIEFITVKGHSGNQMNELADNLASKACHGEIVHHYCKA